MGGKIDLPMLHQHWVHSREEDTDDETVYRPQHFDFPPARGRRAFELRDDGTLVEYSPGPTDRPVGKPGQWKLVGEQVAVSGDSDDKPTRMMTIISLDAEKLVVRKGG